MYLCLIFVLLRCERALVVMELTKARFSYNLRHSFVFRFYRAQRNYDRANH